jgi:putative DNA primase/helicase
MIDVNTATNAELDAQVLDHDKIAELAALSLVEYDRRRVEAAKELNVRASTLDKAVAEQRPVPKGDVAAELIIFPIRNKYPEPIHDIAPVLDQASELILSYMAMDQHWGDVVALWCLHTYAIACFPVSPRLAVESPTHECGKSTLLNIVRELVYRPLKTSNIQPAGIFRVAEQYSPTLIIDEGDAFLHDNEPLRGILNSGHAKGDVVIRVEGDPLTPRPYRVFGACAFGLIGDLPSTLQSRSIACKLKRATAAEATRLVPFRTDKPAGACSDIAAKFWRWAEDHGAGLTATDPDMSGMINRRRDNWRVLYALADVAGGDWPRKIRSAAVAVNGMPDALPQNLELLSDIRGIVLDVDGRERFERISSADLLAALVSLDSRPWADWKSGKPMSAKALANELKPFSIFPGSDGGHRGYVVGSMVDAFARYLDPQSVNVSEAQQIRAFPGGFRSVRHQHTDTLKNRRNPHETGLSDTLTHREGDFGENAPRVLDPEGSALQLADQTVTASQANNHGDCDRVTDQMEDFPADTSADLDDGIPKFLDRRTKAPDPDDWTFHLDDERGAPRRQQ